MQKRNPSVKYYTTHTLVVLLYAYYSSTSDEHKLTRTMSGNMDDSAGEEEMPQNVADLAQASIPNDMRGIRACKRCGILKTTDQFVDHGCENCPFLDMVRYD